MALFAPVPDDDAKEEEGNNNEIPLDEIIDILDECHIIDDCVTLDGAYGDFINPYAFQAKKGNNPDVLYLSQMMKVDNRDEFLKVKGPELKGLEDFGVFKYLKIKDIPYQNCSMQFGCTDKKEDPMDFF